MSFNLSIDEGDVCVVLAEEASILFVTEDATEQKEGTFEDLEVGQQADAFGELRTDGCFLTNELVVTVAELPE